VALLAARAAEALPPELATAPDALRPQVLVDWPANGPAVPRDVSLYCRAEAGARAELAAVPGEPFPEGAGAYRVSVLAGPGSQATDAQLSFATAESLGRGGRYEVTFWVRASADVPVMAAARLHEAPWTLLAPGSELTAQAGPEWQRVAIPFSLSEDLPPDTEVRTPGLLFGNLPAGTTLWVAGTKLSELDPPLPLPSPELLRNPGFEEGLSDWTGQASELALVPGQGFDGSAACLARNRTARWGSPVQDIREALLATGMRLYDLRGAVRKTAGQGEAFLVIHLKDARGDRWIVSPKRAANHRAFCALRALRPVTWTGTLQAADLSVQTSGDDTADLLVDNLSLRAVPGELGERRIIPPPPADPAQRGARTLVGAIRWDGWCGDRSPVGLELERALAPEKYRHRLPFYAAIRDTGQVETRCITLETLDREIGYAKEAGIDYWAFDWYPPSDGLSTARRLYLSSDRRNEVKWCVILCTGAFADDDRTWLVAHFGTGNYQCVLGGRPLVYLFDASPKYAPLVRSLRDECSRSGVPTPFVVCMGWSAAAVADVADACGADALGAYVTPLANRSTFAANLAHERRQWQALRDTGLQMVPTVTTGWDPRPFLDCPVAWYPGATEENWVGPATPAEIAAQLREAVAFTGAHPQSTLANTVLIYAWNENAEGGWIVPTLEELRAARYPLRLDAIRSVLRPDVPPGSGWEALCR
jgi:hypothetical protein